MQEREEGTEAHGKEEEKVQMERRELKENRMDEMPVDTEKKQDENLNRQILEKTEIAIANTIIYSTEKIKRLKKWYLSLLTGVIIGIFLIVTLLHGVLYAEVPYTTGKTGQWERLFQNHSSYDMGLSSQGKPVFISPGEALKKAQSDYSDGIKAIQEKHNVLPFSKYTYKWYINYYSFFILRVRSYVANGSFKSLADNVTLYERMNQIYYKHRIFPICEKENTLEDFTGKIEFNGQGGIGYDINADFVFANCFRRISFDSNTVYRGDGVYRIFYL